MNLENYKNLEDLKKIKNSIKSVYFYRVCGTGMGAAACLLKEYGLDVHGGDNNFYPPMSDYLKEVGIECSDLKGVDLTKYDLIVVGNVVGRNSQNAREIEESGTPFCSFPAVLGAFVLDDFNVVGLSGTHGKTTTTYFCSQIFKSLGHDVGHFVGGVIPGVKSAILGDGSYFFIESDEYDSAYFEKFSKFKSYQIDHLILTSLEFDHADIFDDIEDIKSEFRELVQNRDLKNWIVCSEYKAAMELVSEFGKQASLYGKESKLGPKIISMNEMGTEFILELEGEVSFKTNVTGTHNIENITTAILLAYKEGHKIEDIQKSISHLSMVKRREEIRGKYKGMTVIDDFAHHPRAVSAITESVRSKNPEKRIVGVLEPCSATGRSNLFYKEFAESLKSCDEVILCKPERDSSIKNSKNLDTEFIINSLNEIGIKSRAVSHLKELRAEIDKSTSSENVLLVMSNSTCLDLWKSDFVNELV